MFLALDSSTLTLSLALVQREGDVLRVVEQQDLGPPRKISELLPGIIGELLGRHGVKLAELEGISIGLGPGSFTGLRVGLATVKGLAYAAGIKLVGVGSLAAIALDGPEGKRLIAAAVARQNEVYVGQYRRTSSGVEKLEPEDAMTPAELGTLVAKHPDAVVLGPAVPQFKEALLAHGARPEQVLEQGAYPSAHAIARLTEFPAQQDSAAVFALEPSYVRASEAERNPKFPPLPGPAPTARLKEE